jgi:F-type H+-transporting ATPase subunit b
MKRYLIIASLALAATTSIARADEAPTSDNAEPAKSEPADPTRGFNFTDLHYTGSPLGGPPAVKNAEGEDEGIPAPFLYLVGNFVLLLAILAWKGAPMARQSAEKRHTEIKKALDEAASLRAQAKAKLDEYDKKLAAAEKEITAMVDGMRADAEADKKRIIAAAEAQAAALKKDADERISAEILRARTLLTREVANAAAAAAETLIREKANAGDQSKLVETFIADVAKSSPVAKERA